MPWTSRFSACPPNRLLWLFQRKFFDTRQWNWVYTPIYSQVRDSWRSMELDIVCGWRRNFAQNENFVATTKWAPHLHHLWHNYVWRYTSMFTISVFNANTADDALFVCIFEGHLRSWKFVLGYGAGRGFWANTTQGDADVHIYKGHSAREEATARQNGARVMKCQKTTANF